MGVLNKDIANVLVRGYVSYSELEPDKIMIRLSGCTGQSRYLLLECGLCRLSLCWLVSSGLKS